MNGENEPIRIGKLKNQEGHPENAYFINKNNKIISLNQAVINIGRHPENELVLENPHISRHHAQMRIINGTYALFDMDSKGGTFVNQHRISECTLKTGDVVSFAGCQFIYGHDAASTLEETQKYTLSDIIIDSPGTNQSKGNP